MPKQHIIESVRRNIVFLGTRQMGVEQSTVHFEGTGFAIDGQFVVTSLGVCKALEKLTGKYFAGVFQRSDNGVDVYQTADITLIDTDTVRGLAVFSFEEHQEIGFSMDDLETNEDCLVAGVEAFTLSFPKTTSADTKPKVFTHLCSIGAVQTNEDGNLEKMEIDGASWFAEGGAPLIDRDSSKVLGVVVGAVDVFVKGGVPVCLSHRIPTACPASALYDLLDEISVAIPTPSEHPSDDEDEDGASEDSLAGKVNQSVGLLHDHISEDDEYEYGYGYGKMKR